MLYKQILLTKTADAGVITPLPSSRTSSSLTSEDIGGGMHPDLQRFVQSIRPKKNATYVLVAAMGAGEWWGPNINGDFFPRDQLVTHTPEWLSIPIDDVKGRADGAAAIGYGYPTFYHAHAFPHHKNKDPANAIGFIEAAVWNDKLKRVELVIKLDHYLCKERGAESILRNILDGEHIDVSMGCRVPYDVCSICKNEARSRGDYCEHIRRRRIDRDPTGTGLRPFMINIEPRFFDLSFVYIGADRAARVLKKLASVHPPTDSREEALLRHLAYAATRSLTNEPESVVEKVAHIMYEEGYSPYDNVPRHALLEARKQKTAMFHPSPYEQLRKELTKLSALGKLSGLKLADLIKYVVPPGDLSQTQVDEEGLPPDVLKEMGRCGLPAAVSAATKAKIVLQPREFAEVALRSAGLSELVPSLPRFLPPSPFVDFPFSFSLPTPPFHLFRRLLDFTPPREVSGPAIRKRIIIIMARPKEAAAETRSFPFPALLDKLASGYNGYRVWLLAHAPSFGMLKDASLDEKEEDDRRLVEWYLKAAHWSPTTW